MVTGIPIDELHPETKAKIPGIKKMLNPRLPLLGKILSELNGLSNRDALWILRTAINHVKGYHEKGTHVR